MILIIISTLLPLFAGIIIYRMFQQDLAHTKSVRKLKRGAGEALIQRHRQALIIHFIAFVIFAVVNIIFFGFSSIFFIVIWLLVFMGHTQALSRLSKQMINTLELNQAIDARLADAPLEDDEDNVDYEPIEQATKRKG